MYDHTKIGIHELALQMFVLGRAFNMIRSFDNCYLQILYKKVWITEYTPTDGKWSGNPTSKIFEIHAFLQQSSFNKKL